MPNVNKQPDQLSGHLELIAVPLPNLSTISGLLLYVHDLNGNYLLQCARESLSLSSPSGYSKPGCALSHKVAAFIRGRSDENDRILETMLRYRYVVVLRNQDGNYTRIGDLTKGLSFSYVYASDPDQNGSLGYNISFEGDTLTGQRPVDYPFNIE